jgi:hypothetical protein
MNPPRGGIFNVTANWVARQISSIKSLTWRHVLILLTQIRGNWIIKFVIYSMRRQFLLLATDAIKPSNATEGVFLHFFFFRRNTFSSLDVLAFSTYNFHLLRSWMQVIQFFIFSFFMSFIMSFSHLFFGLPSGSVNIGFHIYTVLYYSLFRHSM